MCINWSIKVLGLIDHLGYLLIRINFHTSFPFFKVFLQQISLAVAYWVQLNDLIFWIMVFNILTSSSLSFQPLLIPIPLIFSNITLFQWYDKFKISKNGLVFFDENIDWFWYLYNVSPYRTNMHIPQNIQKYPQSWFQKILTTAQKYRFLCSIQYAS